MKQKYAGMTLSFVTAAAMLASGTIPLSANEHDADDPATSNNVMQTFLSVVRVGLNNLVASSLRGPPTADQALWALSDAAKLLKELANGKADLPDGRELANVKIATPVPPAEEKSVDIIFRTAVKALNDLGGSAYFCAEIAPHAADPKRVYGLECHLGGAKI